MLQFREITFSLVLRICIAFGFLRNAKEEQERAPEGERSDGGVSQEGEVAPSHLEPIMTRAACLQAGERGLGAGPRGRAVSVAVTRLGCR